MSFTADIREFCKELGSEVAAFFKVLGLSRIDYRAHKRFLLSMAGLFLFLQQVYFWTGKAVMLPSGALFTNNALYGWDSPRVVDDMIIPAHNVRSNVHPLFVLYAKPAGAFFNRLLNLTKHTSAIGVSSCVAALNVAVLGLIFYLLGAGAGGAALFAALFGVTTTNFWLGAIPETGCFSILTILIVYLLAVLALKHGIRSHFFWILSGLFSYGNAVTNFLKNGIAFLAVDYRKGEPLRTLGRAALYGVIVISIALVLTLWTGSSLAWKNDLWIATPELRKTEHSVIEAEGGGDLPNLPIHMIRCFFAHTIVAPTPMFNPRVIFQDMDGPVVMFNGATYKPWPGALTLGWLSIVAVGLLRLSIKREPDQLRLGFIIAGALTWDFAFFSQYYVPFEGVFVWSAHYLPSVFMLSAFAVPLIERIPRPVRFGLGIAMAFAITAILLNNFLAIRESARLLTQG